MQPGPKTKQLPHVILVCLLLALVVTIFRAPPSASPASTSFANDSGVKDIAPGSSIHDQLTPGAKATFSVSVTAGSLLRFSIDKDDLGLSTTLYGPTGETLLEHVSHDFEVVDLSFPVQTTGAYKIELVSREQKQTRSFELKLQALTPITEVNEKDSEARQALARAEVLRAQSTETAFRKAIEQYDEATQSLSSLSDFAGAANASLKSGDVLFDLSEYTEALKRYQAANSFAEKTGDWLAKAKALGRMGRVESYMGNPLAQQHVDQTLELSRPHAGDPNPNATNVYGESLSIQAGLLLLKGAFEKARHKYEEALNAFHGDRQNEAMTRLSLGQISGSMGYLEQAEPYSSRARELFSEIENKRGEGLALISLGLANSFRDVSKAIDYFRQARSIFSLLGDKTSEAFALNALGQANENLHDDAAVNYYKQALALFEQKGLKDPQTTTLLRIGTLYFDKDLDKALAFDERCLELSQQMGNARTEALARTEIARVYTAQKRYDLAAAQYQHVLHFYESTKDLRALATTLGAYGDFLLQVGEKQKALDSFDRALSLSDTVHDQALHIDALYYLARAHLQLGALEHALDLIEESLKEIEEFRASVDGPDFRASYFSGVQKNHKLCIQILMELARLHPAADYVGKAFLVSENSRARSLRELVIASRSGRNAGASSDLLQRERELRGRFRSQADYRMKLASEENNSAEVAELDRELADITANFQEVEAKLRQQDFGVSSIEPLTLDQIQDQLRADGTMLLEFSLADERSYLFAVTANSTQAYELPARKLVEDAARQFTTSIREDQIDSQKAADLSRMLFGPVHDKLENRRLVIVAEGALQGLPFDPLPTPAAQANDPTAAKKLVDTNEIDFEPSISTLAAIRKGQDHKSSPNKLVAVIADPVLSSSDERVQNLSRSSGSALAATNGNSDQPVERDSEIVMRDGTLARLVHASEEADAIAAAAPWRTAMVAKGFAANRETAMSPDVGQYQIVHFATHGVFNSEHPELSAMVLSMVDRNGTNTNGFMPLQDIYSLHLSAELTVLSACETALGRDVKGEGLVGLTHSFLSAGSKSVVATLWKVDDRATAVFMAKFYKWMLQEGLSPAAALRQAKLEMMHDKQWSAPKYWAGFVLQGEYENHINVDRYASVRLALVLLLLLSLSAAGLLVYRGRKRRIAPTPQAEQNTIR